MLTEEFGRASGALCEEQNIVELYVKVARGEIVQWVVNRLQ